MAFVIKALGKGSLTVAGTADLYTVPDPKSALVTSVRVVNNSTVNAATLNLYVKASGGATTARRLVKQNYVAGVGGMLLMEDVVTLGKGDKIQVNVSGTSPDLGYLVNGLERD